MSQTRTNKLLDKAIQGKTQMTKDIAALDAKNKKLTTKCEEQDAAIKKLTKENAELTDKLDMAGAELEEMKKAAESKKETATLADMATAVPVK